MFGKQLVRGAAVLRGGAKVFTICDLRFPTKYNICVPNKMYKERSPAGARQKYSRTLWGGAHLELSKPTDTPSPQQLAQRAKTIDKRR